MDARNSGIGAPTRGQLPHRRLDSALSLQSRESGTDGEMPSGPYNVDEDFDWEGFRERELERWSSPLDAPGWRRAWGVFVPNDAEDGGAERMVGHCTLAAGDLATAVHRAQMGLGVQRPFRRRGYGLTLVETALEWARAIPSLDWVDLGVFEGNDHALAMYERLGFERIGRTPDIFRVNGESITSIAMTLNVASTQVWG